MSLKSSRSVKYHMHKCLLYRIRIVFFFVGRCLRLSTALSRSLIFGLFVYPVPVEDGKEGGITVFYICM